MSEEKTSRSIMNFGDEAAPYVVEIDHFNELRPGDMVGEGVFIRSMSWTNGIFTRLEAAPCWTEEIVLDDGRKFKEPRWGESIEMEPKFPMKVIRGMTPPELPKSV